MFVTESSKRLKSIRIAKGLTQKAFAEKLGVKLIKIRDIEVGKLKVSLEISLLMESIFNINMRWLLSGQGNINIKDGGLSIAEIEMLSTSHVAEPTPEYNKKSVAEEIVDLIENMPKERQRECVQFCKEKKFLSDLMQQKMKETS